MSLNERFGRGGANVRKLDVPDTPDTNMLQKLLSDLSTGAPGTQCEVSWQSDSTSYILSLSHSRQTARANWKLYRGKGLQPQLIWDYATNDVSVVRKLVVDALKQVSATQSQIRVPTIHAPKTVPEERRAININGNLSGKLRKLFIGAQEDLIAGTHPSSSAISKPQVPARLTGDYVDSTPGRQLLQHLFFGQFGIFSHPTFLFFIEREYREALENNSPLTLVIFNTVETTAAKSSKSLPPAVLHEVAKRIKHTQRKTDILSEYAQNTFAVLLPDTNTTGGISFIRRVEKALLKTALMEGLSNTSIKFTFGLATLGEHCKTLPILLSFAEKALEKAQQLGIDIASDRDLLSEPSFDVQAYSNKIVDLAPTQKLVAELISAGIFTYPAFLAFLEHEYYRCLRNKRDLLIMLLKVRVYEETFDDATNLLTPPAFYEVIRRVGSLLTKRDIFAHYGHGNFIIMRSNTSIAQMQSFAKRAVQAIISEEWLTPECPANSLRTRTQICTVQAHETEPNLFRFVEVK